MPQNKLPGKSVLSGGKVMSDRPSTQQKPSKVGKDGWMRIPKIFRERFLNTEANISIQKGQEIKNIKVKVDKYGGFKLTKEQKAFIGVDHAHIVPTSTGTLNIIPVAQKLVQAPTQAPMAAPQRELGEAAIRYKERDVSKVKMVPYIKIDDVENMIMACYKMGRGRRESRTPLLLGDPGIGKSVGVRDAGRKIAKMMDRQFVEWEPTGSMKEYLGRLVKNRNKIFLFHDLRLVEYEPWELHGRPTDFYEEFPKEGITFDCMVYKPPAWAQMFQIVPGILFLDEITNIERSDLIAAAYKLVLEKKAGDRRFHKDVLVVSAGNPPEVSGIAQDLPLPLVDRCSIIPVRTPTIISWAEWMDTRDMPWDRRILAFLMHKKFREYFMKIPESVGGRTKQAFPSPRSWTTISDTIVGIPDEQLQYLGQLINSSVGEVAGSQFMSFLKVQPPDLEELLKNPDMWNTLSLDVKWLSLMGLAGSLKEVLQKKNVKQIERHLNLVQTIHKSKGEQSGAEFIAGLKAMMGEEVAALMFLIYQQKKDIKEVLKAFGEKRAITKIAQKMVKKTD